jgi:site-specific DNA-methyltransferase (adenine-specific)
MEYLNKIILGDCLTEIKKINDNTIDCCISSPPYWGLRDYGVNGQIGNELNFKDFIKNLVELYSEIYRVLKPTGTCFINLGDTYNGTKHGNTETNKNPKLVTDSFKKEKVKEIQDKSLLMIPERFAIEMIDLGWVLRNQIIWYKPNQMPQSATDRFTVDFEKIFFFVKQSAGYYFKQQLEPYTKPMERWGGENLEAKGKSFRDKGTGQTTYRNRNMRPNPDGKNMRTVWSINTESFPDAHFATYPQKLVKRMIESGCPENGIVLDPFMGAGTTAVVAKKLNRNYLGFELNPKYKFIAENRLIKEIGLFL